MHLQSTMNQNIVKNLINYIEFINTFFNYMFNILTALQAMAAYCNMSDVAISQYVNIGNWFHDKF